jgi:hypothetical protein
MGTIVDLVMILLFFLLLAFVFSTALLTPLIGKKNFLFVIGMGFVVGLIGGAFFIAPVYNDIPDMARGLYQSTSSQPEIIKINISSDSNVKQAIADIKKIDGVKKVEGGFIIIKTSPMSGVVQKSLESRIPIANYNVTSAKVESSNTIVIQIKPGSNPPDVIDKLKDWMMLVSGVNVNYSTVQVSAVVDASKVDEVLQKLPQGEVVVTSVNGPIENQIGSLKESLPPESTIVLFCGFLGIITGLVGMFIDSIMRGIKRIRDGVRKG